MKPSLSAQSNSYPLRKRRSWRALLGSEQGQNLVELALLTPVLLILVVGLVEMGRYASAAILVGNAARAGAQYGAQGLAQAADQAGIKCAAENESNNTATCPSSNPTNLAVTFPIGNNPSVCACDSSGTITAWAACPSACSGSQHTVVAVQVTASGTFNPLFNYAKPLFGSLTIPSLTISSTATERVAQ